MGSTLDLLIKVLAVLTGASLGVSIVYDWGFFSAIGLTLADLPTSLADHTRSALNWSPWLIVLGCVLCVYVFFVNTLTYLRSFEGWVQSLVVPTAPRSRLQRVRTIALLSLLVMVPLGYFFIGGGPFGICFALIAFWTFIGVGSHVYGRFLKSRPKWVRLLVTLVPVVVFFFWGKGYNDAAVILNSPLSNVITYTGEKVGVEAAVFRYLDKGVLLREKGGATVFRQWSTIEKIESKGNPTRGLTVLCRPFHWTCHKRIFDGSSFFTDM
ncbi:hypothetical protein BURK_022695 [Burkholderia sp. SJ98]|nr:hypothetical protein BURK_022695 [Burkholderia sp. SJ98]